MKTIHVSDIPRLALCNGALTLEGINVAYYAGESDQGKAVHGGAAAIIRGQEPRPGTPYIGTLKAAWAELSPALPGAIAEKSYRFDVPTEGIAVEGKMDALSLGDDETVILDWFAGQQAPDKEAQGKGYGWLVCHATERQQPVRFIEVNVPDASQRSWVWTRAELDEWAADFFYNLRRPLAFTTGSHCRWCPKFAVCPAHSQLMRKVAEDLSIVGKIENLPREAKGNIWPALQIVARLVEAAMESIKADVTQNGPIPLDEKYELRASRVETAQIEPLAAWPVLSERFSDEELASAMKLSKGQLETLAAAKAVRRQKKAAKEELMEALRQSGAVTVGGYDKVTKARKDGAE